jgi:hypothetical protein
MLVHEPKAKLITFSATILTLLYLSKTQLYEGPDYKHVSIVLLNPDICLIILFSNNSLNVCSALNVTGKLLHQFKTTGTTATAREKKQDG